MKYELSAGGVVVKKVKTSYLILLLKDKNNNWTFPKGLIEENEVPQKAAIREIREETGIKKVTFIKQITPIRYYYKFDSKIINKTVLYFLFETKGSQKPVPQKEEGIQEVRWFDIKEVEKMIGYKKTNENIIKETLSILNIKN